MTKIKEIIDRYNISLTIVGTAVVLSTMFGQCSYDYATGDVSVETNPEQIVEEIKDGDKPEETE
jgi:hypothetical protein